MKSIKRWVHACAPQDAPKIYSVLMALKPRALLGNTRLGHMRVVWLSHAAQPDGSKSSDHLWLWWQLVDLLWPRYSDELLWPWLSSVLRQVIPWFAQLTMGIWSLLWTAVVCPTLVFIKVLCKKKRKGKVLCLLLAHSRPSVTADFCPSSALLST